MCCLTMLGVFTEPDSASLALLVFGKYLSVVRRIQRFYQLEPAGSHGVWGYVCVNSFISILSHACMSSTAAMLP